MSWLAVDALNPGGCPSPEEIQKAGADGIRLVAFDDPQFFTYCEECQAAGLEVGVVLARESFPNTDYAGFAAFFSERIVPTWWILGNECDGYLLPGSDSSWAMRPAEYSRFWHDTATTIRERQPEAQISIAGLVAGAPWWLSGILPLLDPAPSAVDIHPYGKSAEEARELLRAYGAAWDGYYGT